MAVHAESSIQLNTIPAYTSLLGGHFVYRSNGTQTTPASANVINGLSNFNTSSPSTWGYNTHIGANGIKLRYNEIDLSAWTGNGLILYSPSTSSQGAPMMELSANELKFFSANNSTYPLMALSGQAINFYKYGSNNVAAILSNSGLNITEGSITLGEEENNIYPFQVTNDGYLRAQAGWIGGENSYVKLEESIGENGEITHYLNIRLSQLDMLLNGEIYGQENVIDVLDLISQQNDFVKLWNGETIWLYSNPQNISDESYTVYQYINSDTDATAYYYNLNEYNEGQYQLTTDTQIQDSSVYYKKTIEGESSGSIVSIFKGQDAEIESFIIDIESTQNGSGVPSPNNIRPISGYTDVVVVRTNENLAGDDGHQVYVDASGVATMSSGYNSTVLKVTQGQTYVVKQESSATATYGFFYNYPKEGDITYNASRTVVTAESFTFNAPIDGYILIRPDYGIIIVSINKGTTATTTVENSSIYTTAFGTTVYGGTFDVVSGLLTITHANIKLGTLEWLYNNNGYFYTSLADKAIGNFNVISDYYSTTTATSAVGMLNNEIKGHEAENYIYITDNVYTDASLFQAARGNASIVYELDVPLTYHFTPQQIELLYGINNLWTNNENISVQVPLVYDIATPINNPQSEGFYELIYPTDEWIEYTEDIDNLPSIQVAGLGQALKFEDDSLGEQQKLIVSSARGDEQEKTQIEIDPQFINFSVKSDDISPLQLSIGYIKDENNNNDLGTTYMDITSENRNILTINENNGYFLETNTGVKMEFLGIFHYQHGLAIGVV